MPASNIDRRRTRRSPVPDEKAPATGPPTTGGPVDVDDRQQAAAVELLVVGRPAALRSLPQQLPASWRVRWASSDEQAGEVDIVLLADADGGCVTDLLRRHPELVVLAAVARDAPARTVVDVLKAGATACVPISEQPDAAALVAAHLRLCSRYRPSGRAGNRQG